MGKFDKYKIDLKGMQTDSAKYEFVLDNLYFAHIDGPEVQKGKVNVTLTVKRTSRAFELSFQTEGMVSAISHDSLITLHIHVKTSVKNLGNGTANLNLVCTNWELYFPV